VNIFSTSFPLCNHTYLYDCYFIFIMQGQPSLRVFQCIVKNIWMPVEFQRIKVGVCTSLIQQGPDQCKNWEFSKPSLVGILCQNTLHRTLWNKVLVSCTNLTQWQKAVSAMRSKKIWTRRVKVKQTLQQWCKLSHHRTNRHDQKCYDLWYSQITWYSGEKKRKIPTKTKTKVQDLIHDYHNFVHFLLNFTRT
jgi:hypothetical protein